MRLTSKAAKVLATSLVLASTSGLAFAKAGYKDNYKDEPACPPPVMLKTGWYLGAQAGYDSYRVRENINTTNAALGGELFADPVMNATGWVGGLMLGYGEYLNDWFYLAGEIFGNVSAADVNTSYTDTDTGVYNNKFEANGSFGLALLPGLKLNDTSLGYIRLGWNWANLKSSESLSTGPSASKSNTSNGFVWGVGIETLLVDNWSVRTEYNHTYYSNFSSGNNFNTTFSPSDNQFMVGVLYHFA